MFLWYENLQTLKAKKKLERLKSFLIKYKKSDNNKAMNDTLLRRYSRNLKKNCGRNKLGTNIGWKFIWIISNIVIVCSFLVVWTIEIQEFISQTKYENCLVIKGWLFSKACSKTKLFKVFLNFGLINLKFKKLIMAFFFNSKAIFITKHFLIYLYFLLLLYSVKFINMLTEKLNNMVTIYSNLN